MKKDNTAETTAGNGGLLQCDLRRNLHKPNHTVEHRHRGTGVSVTLSFNSSGYRGEDYEPSAKFKICVIGESHCFGTGVAYEETFGHQFKLHIAEALGLSGDDVNLINLSVEGASADYCVRTLFRQLAVIDVDMVICHLPSKDRIEFFSKKNIQNYNMSGIDLTRIDELPETLVGFVEFYKPEFGRINQVKNVALLQAFLKAKGVDHIISTSDLPRPGGQGRAAEPFVAALDHSTIMRHQFMDLRADFAADGRHAGAKSHAATAIALLRFYAKMKAGKGDIDVAEPLAAMAEKLMAESEAWASCNKVRNRRKERRVRS